MAIIHHLEVIVIHSPWGKIQHQIEIAPGMIEVSTASHGGIHLTPTLNRKIPAEVRRADGWYEEDLEFGWVALTFPKYFPQISTATVKKIMRSYYPDSPLLQD